MESPVPYGADSIDSNPLLADGSDFPCKQREDVYKVTKNNVMPIGQPQTLSFIGQATHGGGSCQISLTTDKQPTKDSVWKVIESIEGGCPSTAPGNLGDDPNGRGTGTFQFAIPSTVPTGDYTLAWTWFNKIGNREMYMNCAPVTVTGASGKTKRKAHGQRHSHAPSVSKRASAMSSLPNMFVANIGNGCSTAESGTTLAIPEQNLGTNVQHVGSDQLVPPVGNCGGTQAASSPNKEVVPPSEPQAPVASPAESPAPQAPAPSPTSSAQPQAPSAPASVPDSPSAAVAPAPAAPVPAGLQSGACTTPGKSVCQSDGMGIGTCDQQGRVIFAPAPQGTKCDPQLGVLVQANASGRLLKA
ncbi:MAG: hypothetical protein Q9208_004751 [Pyrenodesmia sp. 3 TL-2023]